MRVSITNVVINWIYLNVYIYSFQASILNRKWIYAVYASCNKLDLHSNYHFTMIRKYDQVSKCNHCFEKYLVTDHVPPDHELPLPVPFELRYPFTLEPITPLVLWWYIFKNFLPRIFLAASCFKVCMNLFAETFCFCYFFKIISLFL